MDRQPGEVSFVATTPTSLIASAIRERGHAVYTVLRPPRFGTRRLRRLHLSRRLPLQARWFALAPLRDDPAHTIVIVDSPDVEAISRHVRRARPDARVIVWYWNPVQGTPGPWEPGVEVCTFDPADAQRFGMRWNTTFFLREFTDLAGAAKDRDVAFFGRDKGRAGKIEQLRRELERLDLVTDFEVVADGSPAWIPYRSTLERTSRSRAVLDIVQDGQRGLTLRAMEALFLGCVLITDNPQVRQEATYPSKDVFVLGVDDLADLPALLSRCEGKPDADAVNHYDFGAWLERLLDGS